jgi:hypothetical protein
VTARAEEENDRRKNRCDDGEPIERTQERRTGKGPPCYALAAVTRSSVPLVAAAGAAVAAVGALGCSLPFHSASANVIRRSGLAPLDHLHLATPPRCLLVHHEPSHQDVIRQRLADAPHGTTLQLLWSLLRAVECALPYEFWRAREENNAPTAIGEESSSRIFTWEKEDGLRGRQKIGEKYRICWTRWRRLFTVKIIFGLVYTMCWSCS